MRKALRVSLLVLLLALSAQAGIMPNGSEPPPPPPTPDDGIMQSGSPAQADGIIYGGLTTILTALESALSLP